VPCIVRNQIVKQRNSLVILILINVSGYDFKRTIVYSFTMVQSIDYPELMHLLNKPLDPRTRALIAFQYASAARVGELLAYTHKIRDILLKSSPTVLDNR